MKKNNCYKIHSKIENCDLYEDFYNYEFSCLKTENDKIEKEANQLILYFIIIYISIILMLIIIQYNFKLPI